MGIVNASDLDKAMAAKIDPRSIPRHNGGDQGVMQGNFLPQSETQVQESGHGRRGGAVYDGQELPERGFYGSGTVVVVNDAPPLHEKLEPKAVVPPAPVPAQAAPAAAKPAQTPQQVLARMGLIRKPS